MRFHHSHTDQLNLLLSDRAISERNKIRHIVIVGCVVNMLLMILKLSVGYWGHSEALMADGYHSLNDFAADLIMLLFIGISFKKADSRYSYGYGRYETFSTFLISLFLLFVAFHITEEAIGRIEEYTSGAVLPQPDIWTVVVVVVAMLGKEFLFRYYRTGSKKTGVTALLTNAWHHRSDALASVATLIGVTFAHFLGEKWRVLDPCASLVLVIFIVVAALRMLIPAFLELMDKSCSREEIEEVGREVAVSAGVEKVEDIKSRKNGHFHIFDIMIGVRPELTVGEAEKIAAGVEDNLKKKWGRNIIVGIRTVPYNNKR